MRTEGRLTIQDYLHAAGRRNGDGTALAKADGEARDGFAGVLTQAQAEAAKRSGAGETGLGLQDYRRAPVTARRCPLPPQSPHRHTETDPPAAPAPASSQPVHVPPPAQTPPPAGRAGRIEKAGAGQLLPAEGRGGPIAASIARAAVRYDLPPALLSAVIKAESNFEIRAVSPAGAQGLMQLMPATARELGVADPFDIDANIQGGARYLRQMLDRFNGDRALALAAYNAGPATVDRYGGKVPFRETQVYVQRVLRLTAHYQQTGNSIVV